MPKGNNTSSTDKPVENQNSINRRRFVKALGVVGGTVSFGSISGARVSGESTSDKTDHEVQKLSVNNKLVQNKRGEIPDQLLTIFVSEGYISESSVDVFPTHSLSDETQPGGVERLQVNGSMKQLLFNKHVDGGRLEVNIAEYDSLPIASFYSIDSSEVIKYAPENDYQGEVSTQACNTDYCWCRTNCVGCCSYPWSEFVCYKDCPNCWVGNCKTVRVNCGCE